ILCRWRKRNIPVTDSNFQLQKDNIDSIHSPITYFMQFFPESLIRTIVEQTNLYSTQKIGVSINTNYSEICMFIAIQIKMSILHLPSYLMYWSKEMRFPPIADSISLKRYQKLRRFLHFVDNSTQFPNKLFKIQPVLDAVRNECIKIQPEQSHSVDEQIIPAKTKYSKFRQYNPKKPVKWGFKNMVRADSSGFMYDFYIYGGKDSKQLALSDDATHLQKSAQTVVKLCQHLPVKQNHQLFFDNWFTTLDLLIYLKEIGINACGTIRGNEDLKKNGRGAVDFRSDFNSGILVTKWYDNNAVHIGSNFVGIEPMSTIDRWSSEIKEKVPIQCPQIITMYNKGMGGVDLADMLISLYRTEVKTRRWYIKIFWHCIDIAKVNAWLLYRRHCNEMSISKKSQRTLLKRKLENDTLPGKKPFTPTPNEILRFDQISHWPEPRSQRGRCRLCKSGYSQIYCSKCHVCLCLKSSNNCFKEFHCK
uniref:PiggyBac transposable element-derived protein domain-containing protein n=1 Tax=Ciona intestinalis TaxID=7719 RepID=F6X7P9_CIOIN